MIFSTLISAASFGLVPSRLILDQMRLLDTDYTLALNHVSDLGDSMHGIELEK